MNVRRMHTWTAVAVLTMVVLPACSDNNIGAPMCRRSQEDLPARVLVAQSVPSATLIPCIEVFPAGWGFGGMTVADRETVFTLDNDRGGSDAVRVTMAPSCDVGDARPQQVQGDEIGTSKFVRPTEVDGRVVPGSVYYRFPGACVTVDYALLSGAPSTLFAEAGTALSFIPRDEVATEVEERVDVPLCGAGAPPCPG